MLKMAQIIDPYSKIQLSLNFGCLDMSELQIHWTVTFLYVKVSYLEFFSINPHDFFQSRLL